MNSTSSLLRPLSFVPSCAQLLRNEFNIDTHFLEIHPFGIFMLQTQLRL